MKPLSLSMLKMEKNFIAHIEKNYPRKPYEEYPIFSRGKAERSLIGFVWREMRELNIAVDILKKSTTNFHRTDILSRSDIVNRIIAAMLEVADVSNTLDYLFEGLTQALKEWEGEI